ncbi:hypothetical protein [Streptomyces sp. NPDC047841]|uniref:hypothetical protein n=1 Tax=Streptomyces sp. NPDC047841 TaxID=3154708 RepID=UPI0034546331
MGAVLVSAASLAGPHGLECSLGPQSPGRCSGEDEGDAGGEAGFGERDFDIGVAAVATGDGVCDVVGECVRAVGAGSISAGGQAAEDAQEDGDAGVEAEAVEWRLDTGDGQGVAVDRLFQAALPVPEVGGMVFALGVVVQGEAVGGGRVSGAGGVLPPEAGAVFDVGELEGAAQEPGAVGFGEFAGEEF